MIDMTDMIPMIDTQTVNIQTVKFIGFLNKLAEDSKYGIHPFSTATKQDVNGLLYDDKNPIIVKKNGCPSYSSYPLIADYLIDECHDDIISTWTDIWADDNVQVVVTVVDGDETYVDVTSDDDRCFSICIHDGVWCNARY